MVGQSDLSIYTKCYLSETPRNKPCNLVKTYINWHNDLLKLFRDENVENTI